MKVITLIASLIYRTDLHGHDAIAFFPRPTGDNQLADIIEVVYAGDKVFFIASFEGPALTVLEVLKQLQAAVTAIPESAEFPVWGAMPFEDPIPQAAITGLPCPNGPQTLQFHVGPGGPLFNLPVG